MGRPKREGNCEDCGLLFTRKRKHRGNGKCEPCYNKAYRQRPEVRAYNKAYQKARWQKMKGEK